MKCFRDTVTLFCPKSDGTRTELLLTGVRYQIREETYGRRGVLFVSLKRSRAYLGEKRIQMPKIYSGCTVSSGDVRGLPWEEGSVVTAVEVFRSESGRGDHIKIELG